MGFQATLRIMPFRRINDGFGSSGFKAHPRCVLVNRHDNHRDPGMHWRTSNRRRTQFWVSDGKRKARPPLPSISGSCVLHKDGAPPRRKLPGECSSICARDESHRRESKAVIRVNALHALGGRKRLNQAASLSGQSAPIVVRQHGRTTPRCQATVS